MSPCWKKQTNMKPKLLIESLLNNTTTVAKIDLTSNQVYLGSLKAIKTLCSLLLAVNNCDLINNKEIQDPYTKK